MDSSSAVEEANYPAKPKNSVDKTTVKRWLAGADTGSGDGGDECDVEAWETLNKGFKEAQSVLDQNRLLIQQVNENHQSKIPDNLVKNVALIQEINDPISSTDVLPNSDSIMVHQTSRFDVQDQTSRLDAHDQQIKQLQSDVTAIKDSLKALLDDRSDFKEFQKFVFNWMHHQDSRSNSRSTSHLPASSSDPSLPGVIAKLEEIISSSEERWYGKEHQFQVGRLDESGPPIFDSASIIYVGDTSPITSTEFDSKANDTIIGTNHDYSGVLEIHSSDKHLDEVLNSSKFELRDILTGSGSPPDYGVDMSNLGWAPTITLISGPIRFATPASNSQFGVFAPSPVPNNHPSQDRIGSEFRDVQTFEWKPGWDFGWLDHTRPSAFALKLFVLDEDPKPPDPYTNPKSDLLRKLLHGWCKTASQVAAGVVGSIFLWVVHGQGRPPENALGKQLLGCHVGCSFSVLRARLF